MQDLNLKEVNWKNLIFGTLIITLGNVLLFFVLQQIGFDLQKLFLIEHLEHLGTATAIVLWGVAVILFISILTIISFFKRRMKWTTRILSSVVILLFSAGAGFFVFEDYLFSYIIFGAYSLGLLWIMLTEKQKIEKPEDKRETMKINNKRISIALTLGFVITGLWAGIAYSDQYVTQMQDSVTGTANEILIGEALDEFTLENLVSKEEFVQYNEGELNKSGLTARIETKLKDNELYKNMNNEQKKDFFENLFTGIEGHYIQYGEDEGYKKLSEEWQEWKENMKKELQKQVGEASAGLFDSMPFLKNKYLMGAGIAFALISTFNLVNGIVIRTIGVYLLSFALQRDKTLLNPKEPKKVNYSERRKPKGL